MPNPVKLTIKTEIMPITFIVIAFILAGVLMALMFLYSDSFKLLVFILIMIIAAVLPIIYLYIQFVKEQKNKNDARNNNQQQ